MAPPKEKKEEKIKKLRGNLNNLTSKTIQSLTTNISIIVPLYNSLFDFIQNVRNFHETLFRPLITI